jgi:threonine dehydrogenase-like Zn-dependent dehydrogenase
MFATVMYGPGDVRFEQIDDPKILKPTDAIIKLSATCICGSDLWPYRGLQPTDAPAHMGHEYCGVVVEVGSAVKTVRPGQFVVGSFCLSDNTCPHCKFGFHSSCVQREFMTGAQAPYARVPLADGTLVATAEMPGNDLVPHLLAASDVLGTGWYAAAAANVGRGSTVAVVGDGAVGLMGVLAAKEMGAGTPSKRAGRRPVLWQSTVGPSADRRQGHRHVVEPDDLLRPAAARAGRAARRQPADHRC